MPQWKNDINTAIDYLVDDADTCCSPLHNPCEYCQAYFNEIYRIVEAAIEEAKIPYAEQIVALTEQIKKLGG